MRKRVLQWALKTMAKRKPDFLVGEEDNPYLRRWWVIPRNPLFNIYLHEFCRSDQDVLHDHMYVNVSWILQSGYVEERFQNQRREALGTYQIVRNPGDIIVRLPWTAHRVIVWREWLATSGAREELSFARENAITLFFCLLRVRNWGFHCPQGWRRWQDYIAPTSYGNRTGKGCGEQ